MGRVKTNVATHRRKRKLLKLAKGYFLHRSKRFQQALRTVKKAMAYQFRDRKVRKRDFRSLWIVRLNAACREDGLTYSRFIKGLSNAKVTLDRKMLADLAVNNPASFKKLVELAKK